MGAMLMSGTVSASNRALKEALLRRALRGGATRRDLLSSAKGCGDWSSSGGAINMSISTTKWQS